MGRSRTGFAWGVLGSTLAWAAPAAGFSIFSDDGVSPLQVVMEEAARWNAESFGGVGLHDGIQVAVSPAFATDLGADEASEFELVRDAIDKAFAPWENAALHFEVAHDSPEAQEGTAVGAEIDLLTVPRDHPIFGGAEFFAYADTQWVFAQDRLLTNGQRTDGYVITGADIFLNVDAALEVQEGFGVPLGILAVALTRLMMHEIGHTLGLGHPNEGLRFYDTDFDPFNEFEVDPDDPFAGLLVSPNIDPGAIMAVDPCGEVTPSCQPLFFQDLQPDDRLGRDVLYPVPEPATGLLVAAALAALAAGRGRCRAS